MVKRGPCGSRAIARHSSRGQRAPEVTEEVTEGDEEVVVERWTWYYKGTMPQITYGQKQLGRWARGEKRRDQGTSVCLCKNHTMAARQPPIIGAFLSAREANHRVDLNTLPTDRRWKHIAVTDVIRVNDVYVSAQRDLATADLTDAKGAQWHDYGALADVTLATSATASRVRISFILQDQVLLSAWACKDIGEDQVATLRSSMD